MKKLFKQVKFAFVHLVKGGMPLGNAAVSIIENVTGKDLATGEVKNVDWARVVFKALGLVVMVYLLHGGYIDADVIVKFIKSLF